MEHKNLLNEADMAAKLGITARCLRDWRARRVVPYFKVRSVVRYDEDKVFTALAAFERRAIA